MKLKRSQSNLMEAPANSQIKEMVDGKRIKIMEVYWDNVYHISVYVILNKQDVCECLLSN